MIISTSKISILMSTYNGGKYLTNQLYSLLQQTQNDWILYIRDDGSTDNTMAIIEKFMQLDKRIHLIQDNEKNLGAGKSFWKLLQYSNSEYTIFCDQDDIWFEKKLEELKKFADNKLDIDKAGFVYCDAHAYSDELGVSISNSVSHLHAQELKDFIFFNAGYQGCSILFNNSLLILAKKYTVDFYMHDDIISLLGIVFGKSFFLNKPLMLYRQHTKQVTGNTKKNKLDMLKTFFDRNKTVINKAHYDEKICFYNFYKDKINASDNQLFNNYFRYANASILSRILIIIRNKFTLGGYKLPLLLKTILRKPV